MRKTYSRIFLEKAKPWIILSRIIAPEIFQNKQFHHVNLRKSGCKTNICYLKRKNLEKNKTSENDILKKEVLKTRIELAC